MFSNLMIKSHSLHIFPEQSECYMVMNDFWLFIIKFIWKVLKGIFHIHALTLLECNLEDDRDLSKFFHKNAFLNNCHVRLGVVAYSSRCCLQLWHLIWGMVPVLAACV